MAKDKDEIPNFDHSHLEGPEPAAETPAAVPGGMPPELPPPEPAIEPTIDFTFDEPSPEAAAAAPGEPAAEPPEIPTEEFAAFGVEPTGEMAEAPGEHPPEAPGGEAGADVVDEFDIQADTAGEMPDAAEEHGEIEFGVSGEAGEELKAEEEPEPEQSEEQLADAVAARKLNITALVLMGVGGLGVLTGFIFAFLKGVTTWLAVLIAVHYAALPAMLLAMGLFLFFALKKSGGTATLETIKESRVYEAVLAVAFVALWIAGFCLLGELSRYGYDLKATKVDRGTTSAPA